MRNVGSYGFSSFSAPESELERLIRQAKVGLQFEKKIWAAAGLKDDMQVLDIGCGPGVISTEIAKLVPYGHVHGLDASQELLSVAEQMAAQGGHENVTFSHGSVYELPQNSDKYDFAYARFLYQHLEKPEQATEQIYEALAPGARFCVVDIDDAWLMLNPEPPSFRSFLEMAQEGQSNRGGNRQVGRALASYFVHHGFQDVQTRVVTLTSHDLGMDTFLKITTGFKHEQVDALKTQLAQRALREIDEHMKKPGAWGAVGVFVCTGCKPERGGRA